MFVNLCEYMDIKNTDTFIVDIFEVAGFWLHKRWGLDLKSLEKIEKVEKTMLILQWKSGIKFEVEVDDFYEDIEKINALFLNEGDQKKNDKNDG